MQTTARRNYQYYDYAASIDFNNPRHPLVLQLDPGVVGAEREHQQLHQYPTEEQQQQQQNQFQQQLPLAEHHQLGVHQHEHQQQQHQATIVVSEPQNFDCFLDPAATCYSGALVQPQVEPNSTPQLLTTTLYNDTSLQQCQLLSSHVVLNVDNPIEGANSSCIGGGEAKQTETLAPNHLYHQQLHNETTNQPVYHQQSAATVYYEPSLVDGSNCPPLEQPVEATSYQLNQLVATAQPLQQLSTTDATCDYFHFQSQTINEQQQQQLQLIQQQDSGKFVGQDFQQASGKLATFTSSSYPIVDQLSPHLQELFQPTGADNSFDTTRFLAASHSLDQQQQQQHHFQDQTRLPDTQHYHELIKQPNVATRFSYLESGTVERRQTFEPSLASQEETQSSSAASVSSSEESSSSSILTRDEKKAREANIPLAYNDIINLSIEQFNEQLSKYNLTESQLNLIKDIRRRGKNKVAAQSCRKRKMEQISELQHEVGHLASRRKSLSAECKQLVETHDRLLHEYEKVYSIVQKHLTVGQQRPLGVLIT